MKHRVSSDVKAAAPLAIVALNDDMHASLTKVDKAVLLHAGCLPGSARGSSSSLLSQEHIPHHIPEAPAWSWQCREEPQGTHLSYTCQKYWLIVALVGTRTFIFVPRVSCEKITTSQYTVTSLVPKALALYRDDVT